jgi:membrane protein
MNRVKRAVNAADTLQQRHAWLAVPVAVWKKFGDDQAGNQAALIAYYSFVAIFPLLLVLVTVLNIVLKNDPGLQHRLLNSALGQYPVIGQQLGHISPLTQTGLPLVVGLLGTFFGARGVATAIQNALNTVWEIPFARRPGLPWSLLRSFGLMVVIGLGLIGTTILSTAAGRVFGPGATVAAVAVALVLNIGVFWLSFRLGTAKEIGWRQLRRHLADPAVRRRLLRLAPAGPRLPRLRHLRGGDRPARLAVPGGGADPVRGADQRGNRIPAVAARHRATAVHRPGPPGLPAVRTGGKAQPGRGHRGAGSGPRR